MLAHPGNGLAMEVPHMESIEDARDEWQDEYEEIWTPTFPDVGVANAVARYAAEQLEPARLVSQIAVQQNNALANACEQLSVGSVLRAFAPNRSAVEQAQRYFNAQNAVDSAFASLSTLQTQSFAEPAWQRLLQNDVSTMIRQATQITLPGRWTRVRRTRPSESPVSPTPEAPEAIERERSSRGRPRKGNVDSIVGFVRAHRLTKGDNPTKWHAANVLCVAEATIDNWLRATPFGNWKTLLASLT